MSELKPCPFCGGKDLRLESFSGWGNDVIICYDCLAIFSQSEITCEEDLIKAWNRRTKGRAGQGENRFRRIFFPTQEESLEDMLQFFKLHQEQAKERGCTTCRNCIHTGVHYPGFVMAEENECKVGLKCDTVLFSVKNCCKWEDGWPEFLKEDLDYGQICD